MFGRKLVLAARLLLGLILVVFGLNGFLHFMPEPSYSEPAAHFLGALAESGYLFPLVLAVKFIVGFLLLVDRFVPLALVLLAPIVVNIIGFHLALAPASIGPGALIAGLNLYLLFAYRSSYEPLLRAEPVPGARRSSPASASAKTSMVGEG